KAAMALRQVAAPVPLGPLCGWRLPSFSSAATRILSLMGRANTSARHLEQAAGADPAIAGRIMQLANSAMFCFRMPASTLAAAITRVGFETARKVIAASLAQPLL